MNDSKCNIPYEFILNHVSDTSNQVFAAVYIILALISLVGNNAAIYSISKRNYRCFQKTCIVSLALSDILSTVAIFAINMPNFASRTLIWFYGKFLCGFLPMCQMTGILASSVALMFIALDRYRNVVHFVDTRWNPRLSFCIAATAALWLMSFGFSYPLYKIYKFDQLPVEETDECVEVGLCVATITKKESLKTYIKCIVSIIFLPLLLIFVWFYYNIASIVWKHRKPFSTIFQKGNKTQSKNLDIKVERKIRTFKIIITLMSVFVICRFPYYIHLLSKFDTNNDKDIGFYLNYSFMALNIFNCCLNPLLYTFLNVTLKMWTKIQSEVKNFVLEICCFCCTNSDFDDHENPFTNEQKNNSKVKFDERVNKY